MSRLKALPVILAAILICSTASAGEFRTPEFNDGETATFKVTTRSVGNFMFDGPRPVELSSTSERIKNESGRPVIRQTIKEMRNDDLTELWQFDYSDTRPSIRCISFRHRVFSPDGRELRSEYAYFDDPFLGFPVNIIHALSIPFVMSGIEKRKGVREDAYLWNLDGKPSHMFADVIGRDSIKVSAGQFDTWRVRISVDKKDVLEPWGALGSLIAKFIPEFNFWYDTRPPYHLVQVKAVFGPAIPGSPTFYLQLAGIHQRGS